MSLLISSCVKQDKLEKDNIDEQFTSPVFGQRRLAMDLIAEKKLRKYIPALKEIIHNTNKPESERYIASRTLTSILGEGVVNTIDPFLLKKDPVVINCALEAYHLLLKRNYKLDKPEIIASKVLTILKTYNTPPIIRNSSSILGYLRYKEAFDTIYNLVSFQKGFYEEVIVALSLLGDKNKNELIISLFRKIMATKNDKRLLRALQKAMYITRNNNVYSDFLKGRPIEKFSDMGSNLFVQSFESDAYFRLYIDDDKVIENTLGKVDTFDPAKIRKLIKKRIPLLLMGLDDYDPRIRFKSLKLLGYVGDHTCCKTILDVYKKNSRSKDISQLALLSLARLNCSDIFSILETGDQEKNYGSPLFIYFQRNRIVDEKTFKKYPLLFSQKELFPTEKARIDYLVSHPDKIIRLQAIYSLYQIRNNDNQSILKVIQNREKDKYIKQFIDQIMNN